MAFFGLPHRGSQVGESSDSQENVVAKFGDHQATSEITISRVRAAYAHVGCAAFFSSKGHYCQVTAKLHRKIYENDRFQEKKKQVLTLQITPHKGRKNIFCGKNWRWSRYKI